MQLLFLLKRGAMGTVGTPLRNNASKGSLSLVMGEI